MAFYAKKKFDERRKQPRHQYLIEHLKKFKTQLSRKKKNKGIMFYKRTPLGAWFLGWLFIGAAIFLTYVISKGLLEGP